MAVMLRRRLSEVILNSTEGFCTQDVQTILDCGGDICCPGSAYLNNAGYFMPMFGEAEQCWSKGLRATLYLIGMLWCFLGVAIVADLFMGAIDQITSATYIKVDKAGKKQVVKVWNPTVANLSLMALGSSAPEILLNVIEITGNEFYAGALGPSTIVGSAAFNLLCITAVCIMAITDGVRRIEDLKVYSITAVTSVFAYVWLLVILIGWTPDIITIEEGLITFAFFWILLFAAYAASKNWFGLFAERGTPVSPGAADEVTSKTADGTAEKPGSELPSPRRGSLKEDANLALAQNNGSVDEKTIKNTLKLAGKMDGMDNMTDEQKVELILESIKPATVATHTRNAMSWLTGKKPRPVFDESTGTIKTGYGHELHMQDGGKGALNKQTSKAMSSKDISGGGKMATLSFKEEAVEVMEDAGSVMLVVQRHGALNQTVTVGFASCDISATAGNAPGKDYTAVDSTLTFEADVRELEITVPIIDDDRFEKSETFRVALKDPSSNAELDEKGCLAMVTICNDDEIKQKSLKIMQSMGNRDKFEVGMAAWKQQFVDAIRPGAGAGAWAIHVMTVFFKVVFATVPPVQFGGGWPAFFAALGYIAIMTVLVGDLAGFFGCVIGSPPAITAITFVALGTSMPDTFASKAAAMAEPTADNSVTGSNCVNVFLGLGLPWTIGAIYWKAVGANNDTTRAWAATHSTGSAAIRAATQSYRDAGTAAFVVEAGDLGLSVVVFTGCALICLFTLVVRRKLYGGELGGPKGPRIGCAVFFTLLWIVYVTISSLQTDGKINVSLNR